MVSGGRRRGERGRGRSGKMRRRAGRRFLAITSEGKFTIIETTAAACVNFACKCAYATPSLDHHPSSRRNPLLHPLFFPPRLSFFFCQRDPSSALLRANPSFPSLCLSRTVHLLSRGFPPPSPSLLVVDPKKRRPREAELDK